jgi:hypothetical protein
MSTFSILFGVILLHVIPISVIFWRAWKKGRASLRLMAILIVLTQISFGFFVWLVITFAFIFAALNGTGVLTLPLTAPKIYKNLKIKW